MDSLSVVKRHCYVIQQCISRTLKVGILRDAVLCASSLVPTHSDWCCCIKESDDTLKCRGLALVSVNLRTPLLAYDCILAVESLGIFR